MHDNATQHSGPVEPTPASARPTARGRAGNVALWAVQVVTAGWFLLAAAGKFAGAEQIVATFDALGVGDWFRYLIGVLEIAGAIALLVPRLAGLAGLAFVALMVGATLTQLIVIGGGVVMPLAGLVLSTTIAWGRWRSTTRLWALVATR